jgi:hypothetical protein
VQIMGSLEAIILPEAIPFATDVQITPMGCVP